MRRPEPRLGEAQRARPGPEPQGPDVAVEVPLAQSPSLGETGSGSCPPPGTVRRHLVSRVSSPGSYSEVPILNKAGTRLGVSELPVGGHIAIILRLGHISPCHKYSPLLLQHKSHQAQHANEWARLCSNKILLTDTET